MLMYKCQQYFPLSSHAI